MTTCFIDIVIMFFNLLLKNVLKAKKKAQKSVTNKAFFQNIFKTSLGHFKKTFLNVKLLAGIAIISEIRNGHKFLCVSNTINALVYFVML